MSPEQLRKTSAVGPRSDIWALGVVLYQLLTRRVPFDSETTAGIVLAIVADPPPDLRTVRPELPSALAAVVARCLEKDPSARYPSVVELAKALRAALEPDAPVAMGPQAVAVEAPVSEPLRAFAKVSSVTAPLVVTEPSTAQSWSGSQRPLQPTPPKSRPLVPIALAGFAVIMLGATLALVLASRSSAVAGAPTASSAISADAPSAFVAPAPPAPASAAAPAAPISSPSRAPSSPSTAASSAPAPTVARPRRRQVNGADDLSRATQDRK